MEAVELVTNHVILGEQAFLDGDIGGLEPDDVTDAARDLLAERDGFEFLYVESDSTVPNMVLFAQLGAKAQADGKNLYFCISDGWADSWAVIASDEEDVKAKVKLAFDEARAALEFQAIHGYRPLTDEQKEDQEQLSARVVRGRPLGTTGGEPGRRKCPSGTPLFSRGAGAGDVAPSPGLAARRCAGSGRTGIRR